MNTATALVASVVAMVVLTLGVGLRLFYVRAAEMREKRVHPQAVSTSIQVAARLQNVQASDNFKNLFETPVLFYALVAVALALSHTPAWLVAGAWVYVALRVGHSIIHCTYNKVMHRFAVFGVGFVLIVVLWVALLLSMGAKSAT